MFYARELRASVIILRRIRVMKRCSFLLIIFSLYAGKITTKRLAKSFRGAELVIKSINKPLKGGNPVSIAPSDVFVIDIAASLQGVPYGL